MQIYPHSFDWLSLSLINIAVKISLLIMPRRRISVIYGLLLTVTEAANHPIK